MDPARGLAPALRFRSETRPDTASECREAAMPTDHLDSVPGPGEALYPLAHDPIPGRRPRPELGVRWPAWGPTPALSEPRPRLCEAHLRKEAHSMPTPRYRIPPVPSVLGQSSGRLRWRGCNAQLPFAIPLRCTDKSRSAL